MKRPLSESINNRKSSLHLSELKSAGLSQNKIFNDGQNTENSDISWIASTNSVSNKENESNDYNDIVDHIPKPFPMGKRIPESKRKIEKKYNINTTSINSAVYDENWAIKQTSSFTDWMNFTFSASLESPSLSSDDVSVTLSEGNIEGTLNANGLKIFLQKRNEALNRQKCFQLYHSAELTGTLKCIEEEVRGLLMEGDTRLRLYFVVNLHSYYYYFYYHYYNIGKFILFLTILSIIIRYVKEGY